MKLPTSSSCSTPSPRSSRHPSAPAAMPEPLNRQACKQQVFTGGTGEVSLLFTGRTGGRSACYLQAEQAGAGSRVAPGGATAPRWLQAEQCLIEQRIYNADQAGAPPQPAAVRPIEGCARRGSPRSASAIQ